MDESTAVIVGVVVGGVISTGSQWIFEKRRERAEARERRQRESAELRTACRLVLAEFSSASASLDVCLSDGRLHKGATFDLSHWATYAPCLAGQLADADWAVISIGFHSIEAAAQAYEAAILLPTSRIPDQNMDQMRILRDRIQEAVARLTPYVRVTPTQLPAAGQPK